MLIPLLLYHTRVPSQLATTTRNLANEPANDLLAKLRTVESQMGLVLTLVSPLASET